MSLEGLQLRTSQAARTAALSEKGKPQCKIQPTKPAIQISDADRRRKILTSDECTMSFTEWDGSTDKGESFRVDQYKCIARRRLNLVREDLGYETKDGDQAKPLKRYRVT